MGLKIEHMILLWSLLLIPVLLVLFWIIQAGRRRKLGRLADPALVAQLMPNRSTVKPVIRFIFFLGGLLFLLLAVMNPMIGTKEKQMKTEGIDVIIALDISNSMRAEDLKPNRLESAKAAVDGLLNRMGDNRLGLVVFAGTAFTQMPLTSDYNAAQIFLDDISTGDIPAQGTAIGTAIELATRSFAETEGRGKAIIVISDGENHEDDAEAAARKAAEKGILVSTIGLGSTTGSPIPEYRNGTAIGYKKDRQGNTVMTKLNETMMKQIALAGKGIYVHGSGSDVGLDAVMSELGKLQKKEMDEVKYSEYDSLYPLFAFIALCFFVIESLVSNRSYQWTARMNLFNDKKNTAK
ncbi:MAG: uncharacterized protein FD123_2519 [Bacteroidetes bacterium]|nr:MAG: uncharacterized protein FD123_2519 [Bacteroidota bacterium]